MATCNLIPESRLVLPSRASCPAGSKDGHEWCTHGGEDAFLMPLLGSVQIRVTLVQLPPHLFRVAASGRREQAKGVGAGRPGRATMASAPFEL